MSARPEQDPSTSPRRLAAVGASETSSTRALILAAAKRLFDEQGYDATSLRQIAEAVGMTKAAVYYHYAAKEHLLLALIRPMLDDIADLVTRMRADASLDAHATLAAYLDLFLAHVEVVQLMARDPATQNHPDVGQRIRLLVEAVQRQVAGAEPDSDRLVRTACAFGVLHAVATLPSEVARANRDVILAAAFGALGEPA